VLVLSKVAGCTMQFSLMALASFGFLVVLAHGLGEIKALATLASWWFSLMASASELWSRIRLLLVVGRGRRCREVEVEVACLS